MKPEKFSSTTLKNFLKTRKICTLSDLMECLGTNVRKTVFRKLSELDYQTSYSHYGKYYALKSSCRFNKAGLWVHDEARFSIHGTLVETARQFVEFSDSGYSSLELNQELHVSTKQVLRHLEGMELLIRQKFSGSFVYFSKVDEIRRKQILARVSNTGTCGREMDHDLLAHELRAAIILFFSFLNEQQRRLFAGMEAAKIGKGGDRKIAEFLGIDAHTVAKGRRELFSNDIETTERLRQPGGGRKKQEKKLQK